MSFQHKSFVFQYFHDKEIYRLQYPIVINYNLQDGGGRLVLQRQAAENLRGSWEKWERTVEAGGRASDDAKARGRGEEEAEQGEGGGVDQDPDGAGDSKVGEIWAAE